MAETGLFVAPPAEWATAEAFAADGAIAKLTASLLQQYGHRARDVWHRDVSQFAKGAPVNTAMIERHARQSIAHWALHRAACFASGEPPKPSKQKVTSKLAPFSKDRLRRKLGWGKR